jgi:DNA-binding CsgD family transcriptional regulator/tetratricopeptide (TPR) repeat protein
VPFADDRVGVDRSTLLDRGAEVAALDGDSARAVGLIREALAETGAADDERRSSYLHGQLRVYLWQAGQLDAATADAEAAVRQLPAASPTAERARALAHLAALRMEQGQFQRSREIALEALEAARAAEASAEEGLALGTLGLDLIELGQTAEGIGRLREAWQRSIELGGVLGIGLAYGNLTAALDRVGRYGEAIEVGQEGLRLARTIGLQRSYAPLVAGHLADALARVGRWDEARALCRDALEGAQAGPMSVHVRLIEARLQIRSGDLGTASAALAGALDAGSPEVGDERVMGLAVLIELALASGGDEAITVDDVLSATGWARGWRPALGDLLTIALRGQADAAERARAERDQETLRAAQRSTRRLLDRLRRVSALTTEESAPDAQPYLLLGRAEAARAGSHNAPGAWALAKAAWQKRGDPYAAAYAGLRETEARLAGRRGRAEAETVLGEAYRLALPLRALPLLREIETLARRARLRLPAEEAETAPAGEPAAASDARDGFGLTRREREILGYLAAGWTNREIGEALFISPKTASVHVSNILGKLGVQGRVQAAAVAHRLGLADAVSDPPGSRV